MKMVDTEYLKEQEAKKLTLPWSYYSVMEKALIYWRNIAFLLWKTRRVQLAQERRAETSYHYLQ